MTRPLVTFPKSLLERVGRLNRNRKAFHAVDNNTLTSRNRISHLGARRIAPIATSRLGCWIHAGIPIHKLGSISNRRHTFPNGEHFRTPANRTSAAIGDANLLDVSGIVSDRVERHGDEVVVSTRRGAIVPDISTSRFRRKYGIFRLKKSREAALDFVLPKLPFRRARKQRNPPCGKALQTRGKCCPKTAPFAKFYASSTRSAKPIGESTPSQ